MSSVAVAFTLVDMDGDGQVSKNDLVRYLELITAAPEGVKIDLVSEAERSSCQVQCWECGISSACRCRRNVLGSLGGFGAVGIPAEKLRAARGRA